VRLQVLFVFPSSQHIVHHNSFLLMDIFLMVCCKCSNFSSNISVDEEVDGSWSSNSMHCDFCNAYLQIFISYMCNGEWMCCRIPATYHCTNKL
jgi:hypothetical protein